MRGFYFRVVSEKENSQTEHHSKYHYTMYRGHHSLLCFLVVCLLKVIIIDRQINLRKFNKRQKIISN